LGEIFLGKKELIWFLIKCFHFILDKKYFSKLTKKIKKYLVIY